MSDLKVGLIGFGAIGHNIMKLLAAGVKRPSLFTALMKRDIPGAFGGRGIKRIGELIESRCAIGHGAAGAASVAAFDHLTPLATRLSGACATAHASRSMPDVGGSLRTVFGLAMSLSRSSFEGAGWMRTNKSRANSRPAWQPRRTSKQIDVVGMVICGDASF